MSSGKIKKEIEQEWDLSEELDNSGILEKLKEFFLRKSFYALEESSLLLSRWQRFCKTSHGLVNHMNSFQQHFQRLKAEFTDCVHRFERLSEAYSEQQKLQKIQQAIEEQARIQAERKGLFTKKNVIGNVGTLATEALKLRKATDKEAREISAAAAKIELEKHRLGEDEQQPSPEMRDPGFELSDLTVYLRYLLTKSKSRHNIEIFRRRAKTMLHSDRVQILREYKLISSVSPGSDFFETLEDYDGVNLFVDSAPFKTPKVEDFIIEFEILCAHFNIETSILQEDGRPFSYEIDGRFTCKFFEQVLETNFQPYDQPLEDLKAQQQPNNQFTSSSVPISDRQGLDTKSASIEHAHAVLTTSGIAIPTPPRLKIFDWMSDSIITPEADICQEKQADSLRQYKDVDFELMCELDLIKCSDMDIVQHRLKENSKKIWELGTRAPNSKPLMTKAGVLSKPGSRAMQDPAKVFNNDQNRLPETFDLGMMLPDGRDHLSDHHVLDGKKQMYGQILKTNEEFRAAEQDLGTERKHNSIVEPTISTIFAEHEVNSYMLLRLCRIRELRNILGRQLNFFRSVERRVNFDLRQSRLRVSKIDKLEPFKPVNEKLASILKNHMGVFDVDENSKNNSKVEISPEDLRTIKNGAPEIEDQNGVSIIYDSAIADLQNIEAEMLKMATIYINNGLYGRVVASASFFDDLLLKRDKNKSDIKDVTFINPSVDRAQLLLELFDSEVKFQTAKIEAQYFSRDYALSTKNLQIQSSFMLDVITSTILNHRDWIKNSVRKVTVEKDGTDKTGGIGSAIPTGLPWLIDTSTSGNITMHHPAISIKIVEVVPFLSSIIDIIFEAQHYTRELFSLLQVILNKEQQVGTPIWPAVECVVWRGLSKIWRELSDHGFKLPAKGKRIVNNLDSWDWLENPLLPDLILAEKYSPFDLSQSSEAGNFIPNMIAPYNMFTDPHFQPIGRSMLHRALKLIILRNKLYYLWIETGKIFFKLNTFLRGKTDFWKAVNEEQYPQMGLYKSEYIGRLGPLNYDLPGVDNIVLEDDDIDDIGGRDLSYDVGEISDAHSIPNSYNWKCGPLAISELDDSQPGFDFSTLESIMSLNRTLNISNITRAVKIQILEKNWVMASVEANSFILHDIHRLAMNENEDEITTEKIKKKKPSRANQKDGKQFDADYKILISTNILAKKKQMRKIMLIEYAKE
ncbi:hypothetical protein HK100_006142 [Physocladia obscura]|uniref:Uncharacterized protein n=1 Tax=Physocladia obscura TaxID=109957 RepID=A0AAD5T776_9FUNG|nr:hypothetical protein HK100_006142 [Physocladia obscura]